VAGRRVEIEAEEGLPVARVDPRAVAEVVYALVDNAAKYSPPGAPVRIAARRGAGEMIEVSVEDEGPGVPSELRGRAFDKFFRATRDGGASRAPSGTGMGLAIARGIVEAHGGHIRIEDAPRGGARFVFTLPIGDDEEVMSDE
jgi:two-component system sensor histidine kinase KdpD